MKLLHYILPAALLLSACASEGTLPQSFSETKDSLQLFPDYRDIVIPPNIAPLNVQVKNPGSAYTASITGKKGQIIVNANEEGKLQIDTTEWRQLLSENKGGELRVAIYAEQEAGWVKFPEYAITVAQEEIDPYLSYRLIEPSYELYRQLGIYQRNLTNFTEKPIYENNRSYDADNNHCVNCHNYQNYSTEHMLFHVRANHGGTIFIDNGKARKMNMKCDSVLSNCVYPSWHPKKNWVVFSSNLTGQAFHTIDKQKIEVLDYGSDLVFFDVDNGTLTNIIKGKEAMETFPNWAPDGSRVYYCSAATPFLTDLPDSVHSDALLARYDSIRYNLMSIPFDEQTRTFGEPVVEVKCDSASSITLPRVSPDGRYVLFTMGDFGQFHIWHKSSDLYVKDLQTGAVRPLSAANSADVDSYHTWSSNGRWIVFSSRRDDGSYTRPYIAYFDKDGRDHKAFLLPQEDPEHNLYLMKSYNVPELTRDAVRTTPEALREVIYNDEKTGKATYKP
ncbi:MAG: hypothetical protein MSS61_06100 [Bacteroidales bacterium]|nr:hypothetical protein [Bacteroidales bacterium]